MKKFAVLATSLLMGTLCHSYAPMLEGFLDRMKVREKFEQLSSEKKVQMENLFVELGSVLSEISSIIESKKIEVTHREALGIVKEWLGIQKLTLTVSLGTEKTEAPAVKQN